MWNVEYTNDETVVRWSLKLGDSQDEIMVNGLTFDR